MLKTLFSALLTVLLLSSCRAPEDSTESFTLPNGARIILQEDHSADIIALQVFLGGSRLLEEKETMGITSLAAGAWRKGTEDMTAEEITNRFDSLGARFGISVQPDFAAFSLKTTSPEFEEAFELFFEVLSSPVFPEEEIEVEKSQQLRAVRSRRDDLFGYAYEAFREAFYPRHNYGFYGLGTEASLQNIGRNEIKEHFRKMTAPGGMVIAAAGSFDKDRVSGLLKESFARLSGEPAEPSPGVFEFPERTEEVRENVDAHSSWLIIGFPAPSALSQDHAAMKVLNSALGDGMSSRLFVEVREKRGLAYSVGSFYPTRTGPSHLAVYAVLEGELLEEARESILLLIESFKHTKLSEDEMERAKNFLKGRHLLGQETFSDRAWNLAWFELIGRGHEYAFDYLQEIDEVTAACVKETARKYLVNPAAAAIGPDVEN